MTNSSDEGATKSSDSEVNKSECMGKFAHKWIWVWRGRTMTDHQSCTTCGKFRTVGSEGVRDEL